MELTQSEVALLAMASGSLPLWTFVHGRATAEGLADAGLLESVQSNDPRAAGWKATDRGRRIVRAIASDLTSEAGKLLQERPEDCLLAAHAVRDDARQGGDSRRGRRM